MTENVRLKLFNLLKHSKVGTEIDAHQLFHVIADAIKNWECDEPIESCEYCPFSYQMHRYPEDISINVCLLCAIKDNDFIYFEPESPDDDIPYQ